MRIYNFKNGNNNKISLVALNILKIKTVKINYWLKITCILCHETVEILKEGRIQWHRHQLEDKSKQGKIIQDWYFCWYISWCSISDLESHTMSLMTKDDLSCLLFYFSKSNGMLNHFRSTFLIRNTGTS